MLVLVCYDIGDLQGGGARRLRKVAKLCESHGVRVQYSLFELRVSEPQWVKVRHHLCGLIDMSQDSLRFYFLDARNSCRTEHHGAKKPCNPEEPLVI